MRRRTLLQAAAVVLGAGAVSGTAAADADEAYELLLERCDDVTLLRTPASVAAGDCLRLYDADAETVAYVTTVGEGGDSRTGAVTRDASETDLAA
jgi:hypothetical protein